MKTKKWAIKCDGRKFVIYAEGRVTASIRFGNQRKKIRALQGDSTLEGKEFTVRRDVSPFFSDRRKTIENFPAPRVR